MDFSCYKEHDFDDDFCYFVVSGAVNGHPVSVECSDDEVVEAMAVAENIIKDFGPKDAKLAVAAKTKKGGFILWTFNTPWLEGVKLVKI